MRDQQDEQDGDRQDGDREGEGGPRPIERSDEVVGQSAAIMA
jgi:hypothetical protein